LVEPNAPTTVASHVRVWLDARAPRPEELHAWWEELRAAALELQEATRVEVRMSVASLNRGTTFDKEVRAALSLAAQREGLAAPEIVCFAGHDAGVIAQRRPAGMVLVRNAAGVSHAPEEAVDLEDAAVAARVLQAAIKALA
jgi:beta-ureidopropionase / N-carbamoyl-L-amino-acid hydrolase